LGLDVPGGKAPDISQLQTAIGNAPPAPVTTQAPVLPPTPAENIATPTQYTAVSKEELTTIRDNIFSGLKQGGISEEIAKKYVDNIIGGLEKYPPGLQRDLADTKFGIKISPESSKLSAYYSDNVLHFKKSMIQNSNEYIWNFFHEWGHALDHRMGTPTMYWSSMAEADKILSGFRKEYEVYIEAVAKAGNLTEKYMYNKLKGFVNAGASDIFAGLSNYDYKGDYFHEERGYYTLTAIRTETFANAVASFYFDAGMNQFFSKTMKAFEKHIDKTFAPVVTKVETTIPVIKSKVITAKEIDILSSKSVDIAKLLTEEQKDRLYNYTYHQMGGSKSHDQIVQGYYAVNDVLRKDRLDVDVHDEVKAQVLELDKIIKKSTLPIDVTVFRGIKYANMDLKVNDIFTDKAFMSTTIDPKRAATFSYSNEVTTFAINLPKGTTGLYMGENSSGQNISGLSNMADEMEILLPRGLSFKITSIDIKKKGNKIIRTINLTMIK